MTKRELVRELAQARGMQPEQARAFVNAFVLTVERALTEGESVALRTFGTFQVRRRAGRMARIPGSGAAVRVPSRLTPSFRGSKGLKLRLAQATKPAMGNR